MTTPTQASAATCLTSLTCLNSQNSLPPGTFQDQLQITHVTQLLHAGVDTTVIALWLGHEQAETTQIYLPELSGIASDGRETAGHLIIAGSGSRKTATGAAA
jgi:hypothetical protein